MKTVPVSEERYQNTRLTGQQNFYKYDHMQLQSYSKYFPSSGKHEGGTAGGFKNR
jgi:hypothetical protein